jgi:hypothetical protein
MKNAHSSILLKSANSSLNALMATDAFTFIQIANLELSAQIKVALINIKEKEPFQLR